MNDSIKTVEVPANVRKKSTIASVIFYDKFNLYSNRLVGFVGGKEESCWFFKDYATIKAVKANMNSQFAQLVFVTPVNSQVKPTIISTGTNLDILNDVNKVLFCSGLFSWSDANNFAVKLHSEIIDAFNEFKSKPTEILAMQASSSADEIRKFKQLLDDGIISHEEFESKKKQLLEA